MTNDEILALQAKEKEFVANPIGLAFNKFENAIIRAWVLDTEDSFTERDRVATRQAHELANRRRTEFKEMLTALLMESYDAK